MSTLLWIVGIVVTAIILERLIARYLFKFAERTGLEPGVKNNLILTFRIIILIGATASLIRVGGLPSEWFVAFSTLGGAALGFASTKTIGNFVAGLFCLRLTHSGLAIMCV